MLPAFIADRENRKRRGTLDTENRVGASIGDAATYDDIEDEDDEFVLETKGSSPPPPPSPMEEAQAQIELERQRALFAQQEAERKRVIEQQEYRDRVERASGKQSQAYDTALNYGDQQVGARGYDSGLVDQYNLLDLYRTAVDTSRQGIAEDNLNPMANYNTRSMFNDANETAVGTYRGDLTRQLNEFAPEDFAYNKFQNNADDDILAEILGTHKSDAQAQIDMARSRGQLNDVGYGRAQTQLANQGEMAMADLQDLGGGVLSGYRDQLNSLRDNTLDRVGQTDFSNPFDFSGFQNRLDQTMGDLTGRLRGDLFRTTQGQSFFDPSTIISGSGAIQGFYNPTTAAKQTAGGTTNPLLSAFTEDEQKKATTSNGVF